MFYNWYVEEYKSCHQKGQHWLGCGLVTPMFLEYLLQSCQDLVTCKLDCIYVPEEIFDHLNTFVPITSVLTNTVSNITSDLP